MSALTKLWLLKQKATIRNLFRKPTSAIFTVLIVIFYGFIIGMMLNMPDNVAMIVGLRDVHQSILIGIGFTALMGGSLLLQKRKALFQENDSFYLFSGPFRRNQVMRFLMSNTLLQSLLFSLLSVFMMLCLGGGVNFTFSFLLISVVSYFLLMFFFLVFTDYLYILSITNKKYKKVSALTVVIFALMIVGVFIYTLAANNFNFSKGAMDFLESDAFYLIPLFGWVKLTLISFVTGNTLMCVLGIILNIVANLILYYLFIHFKGDFYEQALLDSIELSEYMKNAKAGKLDANNTKKLHHVSMQFRSGAGAIFSKNVLLMKKTRSIIRPQELTVIAIYMVIALISGLGFGMYVYMMILWIFSMLSNSDLMLELKNYQIYLIPAKPFSKLWYALLPTLLKVSIILTAMVVLGGVIFQIAPMEILQYEVMLVGYVFIFIASTVLSVRVLKSRNNVMMENMLRMLIMIVCALPSIIVIILLTTVFKVFDMQLIQIISYSSLLINFIMAFAIMYGCKGMMNGRELNGD